MLIDVETFLLNTGVNTETDSLLDAPEEHDTAGGSPCVDAENAEALCAEEAEAVLEKDRLSNVHSLTDYYHIREELKEQYQAVMEDKMACWELVGRLNTCLLEIDGLNTFTRHQVEDSVLYAQKEMIDRYLWQHEIQKQLKARLKEFGTLPSLKYPWYNKKNTKTEDTEKGKILHGTFLSDHR